MDGYDETTYGDAFADVYDEWYEGVSDVETTVVTLSRLGGTGDVLELGAGTGRLTVPLASAARGTLTITGLDASGAMLERLRARDREGLVHTVEADMVDGLPDGPFTLVFVAYNTLFNLTRPGQQEACFQAVADRLVPGGRFVVEAFVPDDPPRDGDDVAVRSMTADRVVLSISRHTAATGLAEGHFIELTEGNGVRLRPWSIRYRTPDELDVLAAEAGLSLESRWEDMAATPFTDKSERHVSVYRNNVDSDRSEGGEVDASNA